MRGGGGGALKSRTLNLELRSKSSTLMSEESEFVIRGHFILEWAFQIFGELSLMSRTCNQRFATTERQIFHGCKEHSQKCSSTTEELKMCRIL